MDKNKKTIIGLVAFLGLPFLFKLMGLNLLSQEIIFWVLFLLIILWIYFVEKKTITSIGWKKITVKTIFGGIGLGLILFFLFGIIMTAIQALGIELNQEMAQTIAKQPFLLLMLIALRAGVVEEVLYRGYAFERIFDLTKSKWIAGLIPGSG